MRVRAYIGVIDVAVKRASLAPLSRRLQISLERSQSTPCMKHTVATSAGESFVNNGSD